MSIITHGISRIKLKINEKILKLAFLEPHERFRTVPVSYESRILAKVIRPQVMMDCQLIGGMEVFVELDTVEREQIDQLTTVYYIPKERTDGRAIITPMAITYMNPTTLNSLATNATCNRGSAMAGIGSIIDSYMPVPPVSDATVTLIGENTVMVKNNMMVPQGAFLRCLVEYDENFSILRPKVWPEFEKLMEYAIKQYIWVKLDYDLDMGQLVAGHELGVVRRIVDRFEDAQEKYEEQLKRMRRILYMHDRVRYARFVGLLVGGPR